jgi:hypothetical protein
MAEDVLYEEAARALRDRLRSSGALDGVWIAAPPWACDQSKAEFYARWSVPRRHVEVHGIQILDDVAACDASTPHGTPSSELGSELLSVDHLGDARRGIAYHVNATPQHAQPDEERLRLLSAVELEVDHRVIRIIVRAHHPIAPHPALCPAYGVAIKGTLPGVEVGNGVLDP